MVSEALIFRLFGILVGLGLGAFSFGLMKATKGATKGWMLFSISGVAFFLWTSLMSLFSILDMTTGRIITSILFIPGTIILVMSFAKLAEDFRIHSFLSTRNVLIVNLLVIAFFAAVLIFLTGDILHSLMTAVLVDAVIANIMALQITFSLWRSTGNKVWFALLIFSLLFVIGQSSTLYAGNCCGGELSGSATCLSYDLDYRNMFNMPCNTALTSMSLIGYNLMTIGGLILLGSFFYMYKKLAL
ncbi:MAG: hypothetical protein R6V53_05190 [Candidatus Woesearchaeota archaeon]